MNKAQQAVLAEVPTTYRPVFERAFTTNSKVAGIRAFCLRCVGFFRNDVRDCTAYGCPLWPHRPYQTDADDGESPGPVRDDATVEAKAFGRTKAA